MSSTKRQAWGVSGGGGRLARSVERLERHEHDQDRPNPRQVPKAVKDKRRARNKQARRQRRTSR